MQKVTFFSPTTLSRYFSISASVALLFLLLNSCTPKQDPYVILEFSGIKNVNNYSKSYYLINNKSDSIRPTPVPGSKGDLFTCEDYIFVYNGDPTQKNFSFRYDDSVLYVNDKISMIDIPDTNTMVPWFRNIRERDLSALQFINLNSKIPEIYLPDLKAIAEIKPDAGLYFTGDLNDLAGLLKIFNPKYLAGPKFTRNDVNILSGLTNLELLMLQPSDSMIIDPLPALPLLKQIFLFEIPGNVVMTNDLLINNKQIEKVILTTSGKVDFAVLNPLLNLKELIVISDNTPLNFELVNNHKNLEVLSLVGDDLFYDADLIKLPALRWMTFSSEVTSPLFNSVVDTHPGLEMVEIIGNDTIENLQSLLKLEKLTGLTLTDTVTDITTLKNLTNLKYLSLPDDFLKRNWAELQKSLPGTQIVANEGICLGSGWILLLIPLVLLIRFYGRKRTKISA